MSSSLPPAAQAAWEAYQAMERSKHAHFDYLEALERRYAERGGTRSARERERLQALLAEHDRKVAAFRDAMQALRHRDPAAHGRLVEHLARANATPGGAAGRRH